MAIGAIETTKITAKTVISGSAERLYQAWTTRDDLEVWLCNACFFNAQAGGNYVFVWNRTNRSASGIVRELVENENVVLSWRESADGAEEDHSSTVTVSLHAVDGETKVKVEHEGLAAEDAERMEALWNDHLANLKMYLETGANPDIVNRVIIGIYPGAVPDDRAKELDMEKGVFSLVTDLVDGYSAAKAGILAGDIITHIKGEKVSPTHNLFQIIMANKPGDEVQVTVARGDDILTMTMPLMSYPLPDVPENFSALADIYEPQHADLLARLSAAFDGVSEEAASKAPAEGEWSAKQVMAHLIYTERHLHEQLGGHIVNRRPRYWSGNDATRLNAMITMHPTVADLLSALKNAFAETVILWRSLSDDMQASHKYYLWNESLGMPQHVRHVEIHIDQINEAIAAAS
ncbi:MAG: SRPBCC domain-containing protein [Anaerolineae bacterium]|nr:SRPBCC domain-containing protein [Anaerolineae bacterium]